MMGSDNTIGKSEEVIDRGRVAVKVILDHRLPWVPSKSLEESMRCVHVVIGSCETCIMEIFQKQSVKTFSSALPPPSIPLPRGWGAVARAVHSFQLWLKGC